MGFKLRSTIDLSKIRGGFGTTTIAVGYPSGDVHPRYMKPMSDLAELVSVGDANHPARPHLEEGIEAGNREIRAAIKKHGWSLFKKANPDAIGEVAVEAVRQYVFSGALEPNAPSTIARKGFDQPLVEEGDLLSSLTYRIKKGKG